MKGASSIAARTAIPLTIGPSGLFEHARQTDYPLEGKHEGLSCHSCHKIKIDPDNKMSQTCYSCHSQQDKHRKAFWQAL